MLRLSITKSHAVLSHTWGPENEEVTFKNLEGDTGKIKAGYNKIQFCGKQAAYHGTYFWVDTCCIDKSSSAELSEAINSMFKWYREATRCFAYLSNVSADGFDISSITSQPSFESAFRKSRWFPRGWTLQELIAPSSVEFFSREGKFLGDKTSLERQIHKITGIPVGAIRGSPLSEFTVEERMSWAAKRATKREEDKAYCLPYSEKLTISCLPTGLSDTPGIQTVFLYCAKCEDIYKPTSARHAAIDGAYFGTSFQSVLFQAYPELVPEKSTARYEPKLFSFKVHPVAALQRWQDEQKEKMVGRLKDGGIEIPFGGGGGKSCWRGEGGG